MGRIEYARMCEREGRHQIGPMTICTNHLHTMVTGVLDAVRREAAMLLEDGRSTPGGIEEEIRLTLGDISRERRERRSSNGGRASVVYFAQRGDCLKIGTTINLTLRMTMLATSSLLPGMTAGPVTLLATMPGGVKEERKLHRRFWWLRINPACEWFRYEDELRAYVEKLASHSSQPSGVTQVERVEHSDTP